MKPTPPALPEASALLAVDCCLIWGVADGTDVGSPAGIWPGLRERKKRYVLGGVLGLGDGPGEDTVMSGAPDLDLGGLRGHCTPIPVMNENVSHT